MKHKPHNAAEARWKNSPSRAVAPCIACLHRLGYGLKRIKRATGASQGFTYRLTLTLAPSGWKPRAIANAQRTVDGAARRAKREAASGVTFNRLLAQVMNHSRAYAQHDSEERRERNRVQELNRYRNNPQHAIKARLRTRIRRVVTQHKSYGNTASIIGCSASEFMLHIQSQFKPGMNWNNRSLWHIDHIKPCAAFDLTDETQVRLCFHYTNMQPLWASENMEKGDWWHGSRAGRRGYNHE